MCQSFFIKGYRQVVVCGIYGVKRGFCEIEDHSCDGVRIGDLELSRSHLFNTKLVYSMNGLR